MHPTTKTRLRRFGIAVIGLYLLASPRSTSALEPSVAPEARMQVVAVATLEHKEGVTEGEAGVITDNLAARLQQRGEFRVMERSQMQSILKEQNFQQSGVCDGSECAVQIGKLLGIDKMVVGSVGKVGSVYSLSLRLVEVESGEALRTTSRNRKGAIEDVLTDLLPLAVEDLSSKQANERRVWPWVVGGVVVAGGATAAAILLLSESSKDDPAADNSSDDAHFGVSW